MLYVCNVCLLLIHVKRHPSNGREGLAPRSASAICFMIFARMVRTPIGSWMISSRHWGPARTYLYLRRSKWKAWTSRGSACGGSLHTRHSTTIEGTRLRMVNIILFSFSFSIFVLNIIGEGDEQATDSMEAIPGGPHLEAGQVPMSWYPVKDHIHKYL